MVALEDSLAPGDPAHPELRDGMLHSGMEGGMNQSYAALDALLERTR